MNWCMDDWYCTSLLLLLFLTQSNYFQMYVCSNIMVMMICWDVDDTCCNSWLLCFLFFLSLHFLSILFVWWMQRLMHWCHKMMINIMVMEKMDGARLHMAWPWDDEDDSGMLWRENSCGPKTYFSSFFLILNILYF